MENLEPRLLLAADLQIAGTAGADVIELSQPTAGKILVNINGTPTLYDVPTSSQAGVPPSIQIDGNSGQDEIQLFGSVNLAGVDLAVIGESIVVG
ncbi:LEPR-XLL domain-containing protein, partial [Planctomycetota bacterium]